MRTVTQFAGMQQHYAAVIRGPEGGVYVIPETIRNRLKEARAALAGLVMDFEGDPGARVRVERVYISWEVEVEIPETVAEVRAQRAADEAWLAKKRRR